MIVVDASAYVSVALGRATSALIGALETSGHWVVPEHFRLEVTSAIRREWLHGALDRAALERLVVGVARSDVDVWPTSPLLPRILELAANTTPYDAAYLALGEELGCAVITADAKLAGVPRIRCQVIVAA